MSVFRDVKPVFNGGIPLEPYPLGGVGIEVPFHSLTAEQLEALQDAVEGSEGAEESPPRPIVPEDSDLINSNYINNNNNNNNKKMLDFIKKPVVYIGGAIVVVVIALVCMFKSKKTR